MAKSKVLALLRNCSYYEWRLFGSRYLEYCKYSDKHVCWVYISILCMKATVERIARRGLVEHQSESNLYHSLQGK